MIAATLLFLCSQSVAVSAEPRSVEGHVRDAFTGLDLAGARVELLTENEFGEAELVAETRTEADGNYRLADPERRGAKLRVRHPAYRSTLGTASDDEFALFPRDEPCELRLLDLDDQPVAGARVVLRQTCVHAPATVEATSDAAGVVVLTDLPPLFDNGELSVLAPGFAVLGDLEPGELVPRATLYVPRRRAVRLRLLDEHGAPLAAGTACYQADEGSYPLLPDASGRVTLAALFDTDEAGVKRAGSFAYGIPPAGDEYALRFAPYEVGRDPARLQVRLDLPAEEAKRVPLIAYHADGYVCEGLASAVLVPGSWRVVVGRPFSGYRETIVPLELASGERRELALRVEREPVLHVELPEGQWTVHVQAGGDSISRFVKDGGSFATGVPPGAEVIVLAQGREVRRARHAPWSGELVLDLRDPAALVERAAQPAPPFELALRATDSRGEALAVKASARTRGEPPADEDPSPDRVLLRFPAGARYEVALSAEGHHALYRAGLATAGGRTSEVVVFPRE